MYTWAVDMSFYQLAAIENNLVISYFENTFFNVFQYVPVRTLHFPQMPMKKISSTQNIVLKFMI